MKLLIAIAALVALWAVCRWIDKKMPGLGKTLNARSTYQPQPITKGQMTPHLPTSPLEGGHRGGPFV